MYASTTSSSEAALNTAMAKVYGTMGVGLLITFLVSFFIGNTPGLVQEIFTSPWRLLILLAPLGLIMLMGWANFSATTLKVLFGIFSVLEGVSLSVIFAVYTQGSIGAALLITAFLFGGMSAYGYFTKKDLSGYGSILLWTLIGLLIAMVVNLFLHNSMLQMLISFAGVLLFMALTAYDSQTIRDTLWRGNDRERAIIMGAVTLYLNVINILLFILDIIGVKIPGRD